jgi:putative ABC transport system permease protein
LVWAALWRKPAHTILTLLSVSMAFTLFGVMIGFNASVNRIVNGAFPDRINVRSRFGSGPGGYTMPLAYKDQILRLPGIARIGFRGGLAGYYQDPKNRLVVYMIDEGWCGTLTEYNITPARCRQLQASRTGVFMTRGLAERYHLKPGDAFPVLTTAVMRADGGKLWQFTVIGILDDIPREPRGYIIGNYSYFDQTRPLAQRGMAGAFYIDVSVPDQALAAKTAGAIENLFANSADPVHADTQVAEEQSAAQWAVNIPFVTMVVAGAGMFMVLFLTGNGIYQSVRERIAEFAMLKTLGFSDFLVTVLLVAEAAIPCLLGAVIGLGLATEFAQKVPSLVPPSFDLPAPYLPASVLGLGMLCAGLVALLSALIPALRVRRLDVAAALSGK